MLITIGYVQSKCKAWLGIERIPVKRQTLCILMLYSHSTMPIL